MNKKEMIIRFKELDEKIRSGKASEDDIKEAKKLASMIKRGGSREGKSFGKHPATNDISFYNKYPDLLKDASNVIFNEVAGTRFDGPRSSAATNNIEWPVVGVKFSFVPTIGKSREANDPFNYQMRDLWLSLHRAYRGVGTYEYADLGIAMFAVMHAFVDIARAERIYGLASKFVGRNRSYPTVLMAALGLDPSAMAAEKLADFRYQINRCIAKAGILCLPKGFAAFELYIRLAGSLFKDSDNVRAQWFFYDNPFRLDYDPTFGSGGSIVYSKRTATGTGGTQTLDDIIADINTQLDNLLSDTDIARMCSDILKAFGDNGIEQLIPVPENFTIEPVRDDVRLEQMHNTTLIGTPCGGEFSSATMTLLGSFTSSEETLRIYQEGGVVKQSLYSCDPGSGNSRGLTPSNYQVVGSVSVPASTSANLLLHSHDGKCALDTWRDEPSGDDIVEMTRQTVPVKHSTFTVSGTTYYNVELLAYAGYVISEVIFYTANASSVTPYQFGAFGSNVALYANVANAAAQLLKFGQLSRLDWAPRMDAIYEISGTPTIEASTWDMDNYTLISAEALSRLHDACTLSIFKLSLSARE